MWKRVKNTYSATVAAIDQQTRAVKAKQKVSEASKHGQDGLDLSGMGIGSIPSSVAKMSRLRRLNVSKNEIKELPDWIGNLHGLEELDISSNPIVSLPTSIASLPRLTILLASRCNLGSVPPQIGQCQSLRKLHVDHNQLGSMPVEVLNIPTLKDLNFAHNSPVQALSAPIWFLNEPIHRHWHRLFDLVFILLLIATVVIGHFTTKDKGSSGEEAMFILIAILLAALFLFPFYLVFRGRMTRRLPLFRNWKSAQEIDRGIRWSQLKNWLALFSILTEGIQMSSFGFLTSIPWPDSAGSSLRWSTLSFDGHVYIVLFWVSVGVALGVRILLELTHFKMIPVQKLVRGIFFLLYVVFSVLYLPVLGQLTSIFNCSYTDQGPPTIAQGTEGLIVECWQGSHIAYALVAGVTMLCFHPFGAISVPVWQERSRVGLDIRFDPMYLLIVTQVKLLMMVLAKFFSDEPKAFLYTGGACMLFLTLYSFLYRPCTSTRLGLWRGTGHLAALVTFAVSLWVIETNDKNTWTPFVVVTISWAALILLCALVTWRVGRVQPRTSGDIPQVDRVPLQTTV